MIEEKASQGGPGRTAGPEWPDQLETETLPRAEPGKGGPDTSVSSCPYLGQAITSNTILCLAAHELIAVSARYGDSYCRCPNHTSCSLYAAAIAAERTAAQRSARVAGLPVEGSA